MTHDLTPLDLYTLTVAASRTKQLGLATAVTNPVTRHPAVTASAIGMT